MPPLIFSCDKENAQYWIAKPSGRLDLSTANAFQERLETLLNEEAPGLILDLGDIDYISSVGLRVILEIGKKLKTNNHQLILLSATSFVQEVFENSGFTLLFPLVKSLEEAVAFFKA